MYKVLLTTAALALLPLFSATPSFAMSGIDAARSCNAQPQRCKAQFDEGGGVTIYVDGYIIDCNSPQEECQVIVRPSRVLLPQGTFNKPLVQTGGASVLR